MLVDTHAHLYLDRFDADRDAAVERARAAGVDRILLPAIDVPSIHAALALCDRYDGLHAMAALHPSHTQEAADADFEAVVELCRDPRVVAVGESGLDYYWDRSFDDRQHDFLRRHVRLAIEADLPLVLHSRDEKGSTEVFDDLLAVLRQERDRHPDGARLRGVFHCFTGDVALAREILDLHFLLGLGGVLTFKNGGLEPVATELPLESFVLETDAPYLAPSPHRGKRNEPSYTRLVAERLAALRGTTLDEVASATTAAAERLFGL